MNLQVWGKDELSLKIRESFSFLVKTCRFSVQSVNIWVWCRFGDCCPVASVEQHSLIPLNVFRFYFATLLTNFMFVWLFFFIFEMRIENKTRTLDFWNWLNVLTFDFQLKNIIIFNYNFKNYSRSLTTTAGQTFRNCICEKKNSKKFP